MRIYRVEFEFRKCPRTIGLYLFPEYKLFLDLDEALDCFFDYVFNETDSASIGTILSFQEFIDEKDCIDCEAFISMMEYDCIKKYSVQIDRTMANPNPPSSEIINSSYFTIHTSFEYYTPDLDKKMEEIKEMIKNDFDGLKEKYQKKSQK